MRVRVCVRACALKCVRVRVRVCVCVFACACVKVCASSLTEAMRAHRTHATFGTPHPAPLNPSPAPPLPQVKAWCYYESRLLGAHHGLISTYALETLVLYVFNMHHARTPITSPLQARAFGQDSCGGGSRG